MPPPLMPTISKGWAVLALVLLPRLAAAGPVSEERRRQKEEKWRKEYFREQDELSALERSSAPAGPFFKPETHPPRSRKIKAPAPKGVAALSPGVPGGMLLATEAPAPLAAVFEGIADNNTFIPPDTMGAVGTDTIVVTVNSQVRITNKTGGEFAIDTHNNFWGAHRSGTNAYDPKVYYDQASGRFFAVALAGANSAASRLMLATSKTSSPRNLTTDWCQWSFDFGSELSGTETTWIDYPGVGLSPRWLVVTVATAAVGSGVVGGTAMYAFDKSDLTNTSCPAPDKQNFAPSFNANADAHILMPSINYDATDDVYFAQVGWWSTPGNTRMVRLYKLSGGPLPTPATFTDLGARNVIDSFEDVPESPQPGTADPSHSIHAGDDRVLDVKLRNSKLWIVHTVGMPAAGPAARSAVAWYSFKNLTAGGQLDQNGIIEDATPWFYYFPSVAVDQFDNVLIGFSCSNAATAVGGCYTGRRSSDASNTMQSVYRYYDGVAPYVKLASGENRWGDFSASAADPSEPGVLWTQQEAGFTAENFGTPGTTESRWTTRWAKVTLFSAPTTQVANLQHTVTGETSISVTWSPHTDAATYEVLEGATSCDAVTGTRDEANRNWSVTVTANTTRTICVRAKNPAGSGPLVSVTTATYAAAPSVTGTSKSASSVTVNFTGSSASSGYRLEAHATSGYTAAVAGQNTSNPSATSLTVTGLSPNTQYFFRLGALNSQGAITYAPNIGAITTEANLVAPASGTPSDVTTSSIQANWGQGGNPSGQSYSVQAAVDSGFTTPIGPFTVAGFARVFGSLTPNTTYYFKVAVVGGPETILPSVSTLAEAPASPATSGATQSQIQLSWSGGNNPGGTEYRAEVSLASDFSTVLDTKITASNSATFTSLASNTLHYFRVRARNHASVATSYTSPVSAATLPAPPTAAAYQSITYSSVTITWSHGGNCTYFLAQASESAGYSSPIEARSSDCAARSIAIDGLQHDTVYYVRVGAVGPADATSFTSLATWTKTPLMIFSTQTFSSSGGTVTLTPPFAQVTNVTLDVPPGAFPAGTQVRVNGSVTFLPGTNSADSNAAKIQPLGPGVAVEVTAGGRQPEVPVPLTFKYTAAALAASGREAKELHVCSYSEADNVWVPLPSRVDTVARTVAADLPHFSLFGPFFVSAGACSGDIGIFPVPWEPGSGGEFDAAGISFTGLAAGSDVKVFTIKGELVWEGPSDASGLLRWDGKNRFGGPAASGVYLVHLGTGGNKCLRRLVIVR